MIDFIQYWASFRAFQLGLNPYDPSVMLTLEQQAFPDAVTPMMSWNPPWVSFLMGPIVSLPYDQALLIWRILTVALFLLSVFILSSALNLNTKRTFVFALPFLAISETMVLGQLGGVIALASSLLFIGVLQKRIPLIVAGCILASCKPHLFLVFCGVVFIHKEYWRAFLFSLISVCVIGMISEWYAPGSFLQWISAMQNPPAGVVNVILWKPASFVQVVNDLFGVQTPRLLFSACAIVLFFPFINLNRATSLGSLLALSYLFSGYGWVFDQALIAPLRILAISLGGALPLLLVEGAGIASRYFVFHFQHELVWYAIIQVATCWYVISRAKATFGA